MTQKSKKNAVSKFNNEVNEIDKTQASVNALIGTIGNSVKQQQELPTSKKDFVVFGIDRGQVELATLCVVNEKREIIGDFEIYSREFNSEKRRWEHKFLEKRHILDLSNLRVESTLCIDGKDEVKKVLVDMSKGHL